MSKCEARAAGLLKSTRRMRPSVSEREQLIERRRLSVKQSVDVGKARVGGRANKTYWQKLRAKQKTSSGTAGSVEKSTQDRRENGAAVA